MGQRRKDSVLALDSRFAPNSRPNTDIPGGRMWGQELTPPERTPPPSKRTRKGCSLRRELMAERDKRREESNGFAVAEFPFGIHTCASCCDARLRPSGGAHGWASR